MELTNQSQIQIQNKVFTLGSPVTHADTLEQLMYVFEQQGIEGRPIVVINPVDDSLPDLDRLLENYIENAMQEAYASKKTTSYMFQDATDEDIIQWAVSEYHSNGHQSVDSLIETGKAIREQSQLKRQLDQVNSRRDELWRQHCLHPESNEGSDEYANLSYNVIPQIENSIKAVTERLKTIPKDLDTGFGKSLIAQIDTVREAKEAEIVEENTIEVINEGVMVGSGKPDVMLMKPSNLIMPLSVAEKLAQSPQNSTFRAQQSKSVPGYVTVPLAYLLALGVTMYADGVPIVYTKTGRFRRIGKSDVSSVVNSYWYPLPRYL